MIARDVINRIGDLTDWLAANPEEAKDADWRAWRQLLIYAPKSAELAAMLNPWRPIEIPKCAGFYWAKWKIAAEGTREGDELTPSRNWEVMQVFVNCVDKDDDEYLMVSVPGVEQAQALDSFYWGYGPLPAPPSEDKA